MNRGYYMDITVVNPIPQNDIDEILSSYNKGFNGLKVIGQGYSAQVLKYKNYAIKAYEDEGFSDGEILENFQDNDLFPKLYFYNEYFMVTEFLSIIPAYQYFERNIGIEHDAEEIFKYCWQKGFKIQDIHDENVVVTLDDKLKIIDVGMFKRIYGNPSLGQIIKESSTDFIELGNIIEHIKRPPIAI
jgi:serine/threonine protein kinase